MKPGPRAGFVIAGILLIYLALLFPELGHLLSAPTALSFWYAISQVLFVLATAALVLIAGWALTEGRFALAAAVTAVAFYLLNPLTLTESMAPSAMASAREAYYVLLFCMAWLWMRNWSAFMRSLVLAALFAIGLSLGARSCFWIALALVPWVLFHRRPIVAAGTLLTVTLLGSLLYGGYWVVAELVRTHILVTGQPLRDAAHRLTSLWNVTHFWADYPVEGCRHLRSSVVLVSLPWTLLALWSAGERLWQMISMRRSDLVTFMSTLIFLTLLASCGTASGDTFLLPLMALATFMILSVPLVASDVAERGYLLNRGARMAAASGLLGAFAGHYLWADSQSGILMASALVILVASGFTYLPPALGRRMSLEIRLRSVLAGASLGGWLAAGIFR